MADWGSAEPSTQGLAGMRMPCAQDTLLLLVHLLNHPDELLTLAQML